MASTRLENVALASTLQKPDQSVTIDIDGTKAGLSAPLVVAETFPDLKIYESIEEFNANLPETVTLLRSRNGSNVYLIGTAHFSEESQKDVAGISQHISSLSTSLTGWIINF